MSIYQINNINNKNIINSTKSSFINSNYLYTTNNIFYNEKNDLRDNYDPFITLSLQQIYDLNKNLQVSFDSITVLKTINIPEAVTDCNCGDDTKWYCVDNGVGRICKEKSEKNMKIINPDLVGYDTQEECENNCIPPSPTPSLTSTNTPTPSVTPTITPNPTPTPTLDIYITSTTRWPYI